MRKKVGVAVVVAAVGLTLWCSREPTSHAPPANESTLRSLLDAIARDGANLGVLDSRADDSTCDTLCVFLVGDDLSTTVARALLEDRGYTLNQSSGAKTGDSWATVFRRAEARVERTGVGSILGCICDNAQERVDGERESIILRLSGAGLSIRGGAFLGPGIVADASFLDKKSQVILRAVYWFGCNRDSPGYRSCLHDASGRSTSLIRIGTGFDRMLPEWTWIEWPPPARGELRSEGSPSAN